MTVLNDTYSEVRNQIVDAAGSLFRNDVMSHSGHANLSARAASNSMLLTFDGHVRNLTSDGIALVGLDGKVLEGNLDPTNAEIVTMHSEIYKLKPEVGGIIHTHSPSLLVFAMAQVSLPCRYEGLLRFGQAVDVPVVPWAPRGSERSVGGIVDAVKRYPDTKAVLLANHGVLVFAQSVSAAASLLTVLEEAATAELSASTLNGAKDFPQGALDQVLASMARAR